ncbi:MAG: glutamate-5-semialdehyde dehydrogenase [Cyanobacteria bacterium P01_H01_bin.121]
MEADATTSPELSVNVQVEAAHTAFLNLNLVPDRVRCQTLKQIAIALDADRAQILEANTLDLEACQDMAIPDLLREWLKLTPERLAHTIQALHDLSGLVSPMLTAPAMGTALDMGQTTAGSYMQRVPIGVIALIYEALPELSAMMAGLCLLTGNSLILRGGSEASHSNQVIVQIIQSVLEASELPTHCVSFLSPDQGATLKELVTLNQSIDLIIPYGRPSLVQQVLRQATAPVLRPGIGNCYLYWSASANLDVVRWLLMDSHASDPDPVNAIEKVLLDPGLKDYALKTLWSSLRDAGFELRGEASLVEKFPELQLAQPTEWSEPYLTRTIAFREVETVDAAITWINRYSSGHADSIATESYGESRLFAQSLKSATVHINSSPRFYRNPNHGYHLAIGMSNQPGSHWGRIGIESLTTLKQVTLGHERI